MKKFFKIMGIIGIITISITMIISFIDSNNNDSTNETIQSIEENSEKIFNGFSATSINFKHDLRMAFDDDWIYFTPYEGHIYRCKEDGSIVEDFLSYIYGESNLLPESAEATQLNIIGDWLYFRYGPDFHHDIFRINIKNKKFEKIIPDKLSVDSIQHFLAINNKLYFDFIYKPQSEDNLIVQDEIQGIARMNLDGSNVEILTQNMNTVGLSFRPSFIFDDKYIYYNDKNRLLHQIDIDTLEDTELFNLDDFAPTSSRLIDIIDIFEVLLPYQDGFLIHYIDKYTAEFGFEYNNDQIIFVNKKGEIENILFDFEKDIKPILASNEVAINDYFVDGDNLIINLHDGMSYCCSKNLKTSMIDYLSELSIGDFTYQNNTLYLRNRGDDPDTYRIYTYKCDSKMLELLVEYKVKY